MSWLGFGEVILVELVYETVVKCKRLFKEEPLWHIKVLIHLLIK